MKGHIYRVGKHFRNIKQTPEVKSRARILTYLTHKKILMPKWEKNLQLTA